MKKYFQLDDELSAETDPLTAFHSDMVTRNWQPAKSGPVFFKASKRLKTSCLEKMNSPFTESPKLIHQPITQLHRIASDRKMRSASPSILDCCRQMSWEIKNEIKFNMNAIWDRFRSASISPLSGLELSLTSCRATRCFIAYTKNAFDFFVASENVAKSFFTTNQSHFVETKAKLEDSSS